MKWEIILALMAIAECSLIGHKITYPYHGGLWRPMVFATHKIVEVNGRWVRVDRPIDRQTWVYLNDDVSFSK